MAALPLHPDLQLTGSRRETTPPDPHRAHWQIRHNMHAVQGIKALHRQGIHVHPQTHRKEFGFTVENVVAESKPLLG